ncbi:hypothetical protein PAHAL_5G414000 [Panicum hallii]|uniref:NB-ARC domain-containing protein n=1 Tax=Panicum hallii TaxID=206008 RepID=A0A2S3HWC2_9POAL|nr:putative disease resistance protein RGA1 isoform X1 [Panicum hallii]XP_025815812.1 putative disease resistance protein RGA1 isoform X1 [Panicum hallii]XP_025815813.1 putative disease resistance protein RGA1 isoform X1 [Panicum hallii]PAN31366.1 hypothetical protein PAHAL_5G414000 [Panicum hallii]
MAEIGGMLAAAVVKAAYGKVAAAAGDLVAQQRMFRRDIEYMRDALESIEALMGDAERRSIEEKSVQLWLNRLTTASYDISDIFDELEANATRKSALQKLKVLNLCLTAASKVGMADRMREVRERLENISKQRQEFSFTAGNSSYAQQVIDERETSSEVIKADTILGRDQDKQKVIALLTQASPSSEFIILPIYGIGGIGKTTLAQLVFNDTHFKDYEKAWVYVSQAFDLKKVGDSIRSKLQNNQSQLTDTEQPHDDPPALTKILIVLDDLWENDEFKVDDLKHSLKKFCNGRKVHVIVTTRDASIAQKIQTTEAYAIEPLSSDTCWTIIKQAIGGFEDRADKRRLEDIGKEIAMKCQGVALAARALGYILMRSMNFDGWVSVRDNDIWNISATECTPSPYDTVLASLKLSYISMLPYLRPCFAYCAIFPKGRKMAKDDLIYQWAALGFINKLSNEDSTWLQNGESIIRQLLGMSFLQHSNSPSSYGQPGKNVTFFTMHDLVHDLARSIMRDEVLDTTIKHNARGSNYRYVSLADCTKPLNSFVTYPDKIRALCFPGSAKVGRDADGFSCAKYLRVLDLAECSIQSLPYSIGQLKLLRYLNAPGIKDRVIPSCITKLSKLIYLNLRGSSEILALPESIGEMEDLQYLDLSGCEKIRKLPKSFEKLRNLVHLDLSDCPEANGIARALCSLSKLRYLNLSRENTWLDFGHSVPLRGLPEVIGKLIELRYLNLSNCTGYIFDPRTTVSEGEENSYPYIQKMENSGPVGSFLDTISTLSNLEYLDLSRNMVYSIPDSFCSLSKLHTLDLTGCYNLIRLPENVDDMDMLKFLIVKDCRILINTSNLQSNKHVIPLPEFVVHAAEGEHSSNLVLLKNGSPPELELCCLENVKSVEEARAIKLREKQSMVKLTLAWTTEKRFVEDMELLRELVPPRNLEHFELRGYNNVIFPTWLTDIAMYLPNLVSVCLWDITQCGSLPPLGQLPNLKSLKLVAISGITKIDRGFCGGVKAFTRLEDFSMLRMESLEEWTTAYSNGKGGAADKFMFPNLKDLTICRCHKLRLNPCPPRVKGTWRIEESDGVLSQWGESSPYTGSSTSSASLACLDIKSSMAPVHQWKLLHHLPAVKKLVIMCCNDLNSSSDFVGACSLRELTTLICNDITSLPQWLGRLTTLQKLEIRSCESLNNLPEWLGDLVSLKDLNIYNCHGIVSLPESIQRLTKLKRLSIQQCPALEQWGKLKENKKKIRHIKEVRWQEEVDIWTMLMECAEDFSEE